ncbi:MAG: PD40 domain-containing protein [Bacteroidaceae bacterium]|nr:PD40 domain-containing protein [Bacteroidaceae bacterium]
MNIYKYWNYILPTLKGGLGWVFLFLLCSCGHKTYTVPSQFTEADSVASLYPDYTDITIPANIAPLNFALLESEPTAVVAEFTGKRSGHLVTGGGKDLKVDIDSVAWRQLLQENRGADIQVNVYAQFPRGWVKFKSHTLTVAEEDIDPYLSYRLIEPGYELYRQLGLYQRNLTNFDERPIYENNRVYEEENNHCVNCHNYQNYSTRHMLFHVRAQHGGTIIVRDGKAQKVQIKGDSILTAGVYPSWHPTLPLVAFSTNKTGQAFHMMHDEKIEVQDQASDLLLYDAEKNEVCMVLNDTTQFETFPCWSPDGKWLYYCTSLEPFDPTETPDSMRQIRQVTLYDHFFYDIRRMAFDPSTRHFGPTEMVVDCASRQRSASFPRVSPDGRYLLYAEGDYGQFHIWHHSSDLFVKDLQRDSTYALTEANSPQAADSYHTWSSNGRWIVFATRRMDGNYSRAFITYFDRKGHAHKAFCMPQRDPEHNILLLKSYNVPELTRDAVRISPRDLRQCIYETEGQPATFRPRK